MPRRQHAAQPGTQSRTRSMLVRAGVFGGALALVPAAVVAVAPGSGRDGGGGDALGRIAPVAFHQFQDCASLRAYYREHAATLVSPYGLPGGTPVMATG